MGAGGHGAGNGPAGPALTSWIRSFGTATSWVSASSCVRLAL